MSTWIYLIRHGETDWNATHRLMGSSDESLNSIGIQGAQRLARHLSSIPLTSILCSPLKRAQETASYIATHQKTHSAIRIEPLLKERSFGSLEGKTYTEIVTSYPRMDFRQSSLYPFYTPGGSESLANVTMRAQRLWNTILQIPEIHIGIVTHGVFARVLLSHATGIPLSSLADIQIRNASVSLVRIRNNKAELIMTDYVPKD